VPTLDHRFKDVMHHFHGGARLHVYLILVLRANIRNRCWPSMRRIAKDTGYALAAVNEAKKWLQEHGAIEIVKYEHRVGDEKRDVNHLQNVYQLTGVIKFAGVTYPCLYVPQIETSENETSRNETSQIETEVVKVVEVVPDTKKEKKKKDTTIPAVAVSAVSSVPFNGENESSAQAENRKQDEAKATATTPPLIAPVPPVVDEVEEFSAKLDEVKGEKAKRKPNRMAQIIDGMWGKGVSGALLPMLMGRAKKKPHVEYNIEGGMTEAEIVAFSRWYRKQNPGLNMPETPYKVEGAIESFRNAIDYEGWMAEGEKYLRVYFPKESTPPQLAQQESSTEEIIAFKQQIVEQLATSGLDGMFGDLFDDYKQENIS
jgi:hypothetical protein